MTKTTKKEYAIFKDNLIISPAFRTPVHAMDWASKKGLCRSIGHGWTPLPLNHNVRIIPVVDIDAIYKITINVLPPKELIEEHIICCGIDFCKTCGRKMNKATKTFLIVIPLIFLSGCSAIKQAANDMLGLISPGAQSELFEDDEDKYTPLISCKKLIGKCPNCHHVDTPYIERLVELKNAPAGYKLADCS